jgi:hypothetical protein
MRTMRRSAGLACLAVLVAGAASAAELGSDKSAAIVVFPRLVIESDSGGLLTDTLLQLTNTAPHQIAARCYLINANAHCTNAGLPVGTAPEDVVPLVCEDNDDCNPDDVTGGHCIPGWQETDFRFRLTARQPIVWRLSEGLSSFPLDGINHIGPVDNDPNLPDGLRGQPATNVGSVIPPVPEIPFRGELKCIQVDLASEQPSQGTNAENNFGGDLIGEATIVYTDFDDPDVSSYNAIGLQAVQDANDGNDTLVLGQEYAGCPSVLILNHFFDDAEAPVPDFEEVRTTLTLVPCSENFFLQSTGAATTTVQLLIYNEFEQRWSRSTKVTCYKSVSLTQLGSLIDDENDDTSVLNVAVAGTLTGQTRIRPVDGSDPNRGDGLLAIAEQELDHDHHAAFNVHFTGTRSRFDYINLSPIECGPNPGQEPCPL